MTKTVEAQIRKSLDAIVKEVQTKMGNIKNVTRSGDAEIMSGLKKEQSDFVRSFNEAAKTYRSTLTQINGLQKKKIGSEDGSFYSAELDRQLG